MGIDDDLHRDALLALLVAGRSLHWYSSSSESDALYDADLTGREVSPTSQDYPGSAYGWMSDHVGLGYQAAVVTLRSPTYGRLIVAGSLTPLALLLLGPQDRRGPLPGADQKPANHHQQRAEGEKAQVPPDPLILGHRLVDVYLQGVAH